MEDEIKPPPKVKKYQPLKMLVGAADTRFGRVLVDRLDNRAERPDDHHRILGTPCMKGREQASSKLRKMLDVQS
jgi:hypothetical protein